MSEHITADQARARNLVGIVTVGTWNGREWKRARHFLVTSDDDARQLVERIQRHQHPGRHAVHITALAASPAVRAEIVATVGRQVAAATQDKPRLRGLLWTRQWWAREALERTT